MFNSQANVDVRDDHAQLIRELGAAGIVLLKNNNNTLPLKAPKNIGVFGNDAADLVDGLYSLGAVGNYETGVLAVAGGASHDFFVLNGLMLIVTRQARVPVDSHTLCHLSTQSKRELRRTRRLFSTLRTTH